ncbi:hypothetical protein [Rhizobium ruizarguesonis]|uniref:hypothetical protein n=1 Tax=Rhizobium ruizarguesonis TaxID=2081791 RepID=UPI001030F828|nr:hypothetical protein [Rhizobium ruizarguesonis]TAV14735.1 hypothetical protein ELI34_04305 [Rhizobium ruizarguesonis]
MKSELTIEAIQARKKEIDREIIALREEADQLDVALKVFKRFAAPTVSKPSDDDNKLGPARPAGVPTLYEMTYTVIRDAESRGKPGLTGREIIDAVAQQYWPGLKRQQVLPSIYTFAKQGRLNKGIDGRFRTPVALKNDSASDTTEAE